MSDNKPKHTPGPWRSDGIYVWAPGGKMVADFPLDFEDDDGYLARIRGVGRRATVEEQRANAELMAAAPDMLSTLLAVRDWIASCPEMRRGAIGTAASQAPYVLADINAVIIKAGG
jgi:hypothetical protein